MSGLVQVWNQIRVERKAWDEQRSPEDYLIRGEPNQVIRWSITAVIALLHLLRIFYFDQGYCLLTLFFGFYYLDHLIDFLFPKLLCVRVASDGFFSVHRAPDGRNIVSRPRITALFAHKMSTSDFISFVNRILEFKFWFTTTKTVLVAFSLTWVPILKCSGVGPEILLLWIVLDGWGFVRAMVESAKKSKSEAAFWSSA